MQTYGEMQTELTSRLGVASNSTKFPPARIQTLIKDAHLWATALYPFRELTVPKTTTGTGNNYYDYPPEYRANSIQFIYVNNLPYRKRAYQDFLEYVRLNPSGTKRRFADLNRLYFLHPVPAIGAVIDVYGQVQATQFVNSGDKSIFSDANDDGNEAIILKAEAVAKGKPDKEQQAVIILTKIYSDQKDKGQFDLPMAKPIFDVPDFFGGGISAVNFQRTEDDSDDDDF